MRGSFVFESNQETIWWRRKGKEREKKEKEKEEKRRKKKERKKEKKIEENKREKRKKNPCLGKGKKEKGERRAFVHSPVPSVPTVEVDRSRIKVGLLA